MAWIPLRRGAARLALLSVGLALPVLAQEQFAALAGLSLEELGNIEITSASRRTEPLSDAPTSVFVITAEDIRRSGATSLPEALRLAPNLQVDRVSAYGWAISSRGFNGSSANKLLVLIDGRSVYTPLFGGVFWDVQDPMLEDVERIEVISGPGGTLWGVNAVNGVINVITKTAARTQGTLLSGGIGSREDQLSLRQGLALGESGHLRLYARHTGREHTETAAGMALDDAGHQARLGFRGDWGGNADSFTLQGEAYRGRRGQPVPGSIVITGLNVPLGAIELSGGHLLGRWEGRRGSAGDWSVQAYYDRTEREVPPFFNEDLELLDLQLQHTLRPHPAHTLVWGAQLRQGRDRITNSRYFAFLPARLDQRWSSLFAQDEIRLHEPLRLTLGARMERNDYTGWEFLPNARLAWKFGADELLWTALSRTVRGPTRLDRDPFVPGIPPFLLRGGPAVRSEVARVFELGWRGRPAPWLSASVTAFHARYEGLHTQEVDPSRRFLVFGNGMQGRLNGVEAWGVLQAADHWRLQAGVTRLWQDLRLQPGSTDTTAVAAAEGANPARQEMLRSSLDLPRGVELDLTARHVSALSTPAVPGYVAVDLRLGWQPRPDLELSLGVQNLFDRRHGEFTGVATRSEFGRAVFFKAVLTR